MLPAVTDDCDVNMSGKDKHSKQEKKQEPSYLEELKGYECPFNWKFDFEVNARSIFRNTERKLSERVDADDYLWDKFVCHLVLCFEYAQEEDIENANKELNIMEGLMQEESNHSTLGSVMGEGYLHILLASKCHLLHLESDNNEEKVRMILENITKLKDMNNKDASSVYCMKGAFFCEYGYNGSKLSIQFIEKGLSLDDKCAVWHYLLGRALGRVRRFERNNLLPEKRELKALEEAAKLTDNPYFLICLAECYRETARNLFYKRKGERSALKSTIDALNQKSLEIIRNVLSKDPNNPSINIQCARGLMKLPYPLSDLDEAGNCIEKALQVAQNHPVAHQVAGSYYSKIKNYPMALRHYAKAAEENVFAAEMEAIALKKRIYDSYNPSADLRRCLHKYTDTPRKINTLMYLGIHYYLAENNFKEAFKFWSQVVDIDIQHTNLKATGLIGLYETDRSINEIMVTELNKLLKKGETSGDTETLKYQQIYNKYLEIFPELVAELEEKEKSSPAVEVRGTPYGNTAASVSWRSDLPRVRGESSIRDRSSASTLYSGVPSGNTAARVGWRSDLPREEGESSRDRSSSLTLYSGVPSGNTAASVSWRSDLPREGGEFSRDRSSASTYYSTALRRNKWNSGHGSSNQ